MTEIGKKVKVIDEKNMQIERLYRSFLPAPGMLKSAKRKNILWRSSLHLVAF
jgi:hypothetical protein